MPGVLVLATRGDKQLRTVTDADGAYFLPDLVEGGWTIDVQMTGFASIRRDLVIESETEAAFWELRMLPISATDAEIAPGFVARSKVPAPDATDALLIAGSVSHEQSDGFGNNRKREAPLYTADINLSANGSALDARPFSLTGQDTAMPVYGRSEGSIILDGPIRIPFFIRHGPRLTLIYGRAQNQNVSVQTQRVPTLSERSGDFSANAKTLVDPATGSPFPGNVMPLHQISPQAAALLRFYPLPNFAAGSGYNYQVAIAGVTHRDDLQVQTGGYIGGQQLFGSFSYQSSRSNTTNVFEFVDKLRTRTANGTLSWSRRFTQGFLFAASYTFRGTATATLPHFANRENVSGDAGIAGNAQDPHNWGPPNLNFSGGIAALAEGQYASDRTESNTVALTSTWNHGLHSLTSGVTVLTQRFNLMSEQDARGTFTFTGAASGIDFADFLLGVPAASSIAFGNPERHFRQSGHNAFIMDDWRPAGSLTLNLGVRWEYESPMSEKSGRLVNLDIAPDFEAVTPVLANEPGALTGQVYPRSLVHPDKGGVQPRVGLAWRPWEDVPLVIRAGYGIYRDTGVYRSIADEMAQQSPFSTRLSVESTALSRLTLADGFAASPLNAPNTFAVDPGFRIGYAQNWQLSLKQDLPAALEITATYIGVKGTHLQRRRLPNTVPFGALKLCTSCPAGYVYLTSDGNSTQHAGTIQLRHRQRNGFAGSLEYTWSKAIDDSGMGGIHIAQDWRDLRAERAISSFDHRHRITLQTLYTTGMSAGNGPLSVGWLGALLRDWAVITEWRASSGSPLTPIVSMPVQGTAITGSLRPDRTGAPIYADAPEAFLNASAYSVPTAGKWGNSARNSIVGPWTFSLDASIGRVFYLDEGIGIDLRVDVTNVLNHVTFSSWNTVVNSSQFGLPTGANTMRTIRPSLGVRF